MLVTQASPSFALSPKWKFWERNKDKNLEQQAPQQPSSESIWDNVQPDQPQNLQAEKNQATSDIKFNSVEIVGNSLISTEEILEHVKIQPGDPYSVETVQQNLKAVSQDESLVTYAAKIDKAESHLDFSEKAEVLERKIRAFNPYPAVYFEYEGERYKILRAKVVDGNGTNGEILQGAERLVIACGDKALEVVEIQRQGKKKMPIEECLRGMQFVGKVA